MAKILFFFIGVCAFLNLRAEIDSSLSLYRCIQIAQGNNLDVQNSLLLIEDAKGRLDISKGSKMPSFTASINQGLNLGRSIDPSSNQFITNNNFFGNYSLSGNFIVWNANYKNLEIRQSKLEYENTRLNHKINRQQIALKVAIVYLEVLMNQEKLKIHDNEKTTIEKIIVKLEEKYSQRSILQNELLDFKSKLSSIKLAIIQTSEILEGAKIELSKLINIPYMADGNFLNLEDVNSNYEHTINLEQIYANANKTIPKMEYASLKLESAKIGVEMIKRKQYPSLAFSFGIGSNYSNFSRESKVIGKTLQPTKDYVFIGGGIYNIVSQVEQLSSSRVPYFRQFENNLNYSVGLSIQLPIISSNQYRKQYYLAKNQINKAIIESETINNEFNNQIRQAIINRTAALDRFNELNKQIEYSKLSYELIFERFNLGVSTSFDLLTAENKLNIAILNKISSKYEFLIKDIILKIYNGEFE